MTSRLATKLLESFDSLDPEGKRERCEKIKKKRLDLIFSNDTVLNPKKYAMRDVENVKEKLKTLRKALEKLEIQKHEVQESYNYTIQEVSDLKKRLLSMKNQEIDPSEIHEIEKVFSFLRDRPQSLKIQENNLREEKKRLLNEQKDLLEELQKRQRYHDTLSRPDGMEHRTVDEKEEIEYINQVIDSLTRILQENCNQSDL